MPKKSEPYRNRIELLQGTLDLIILNALRWGPRHGYGITTAIRAGSGDRLDVETGSLYPALHRLERQGWIEAEWGMTENRQRAKYYTLTAAGKRRLATEQTKWETFSGAVAMLLDAERGKA